MKFSPVLGLVLALTGCEPSSRELFPSESTDSAADAGEGGESQEGTEPGDTGGNASDPSASGGNSEADGTPSADDDSYYQSDYALVRVEDLEQGEDLQGLLDEHKKIRLENADYTAVAPATLRVGAGYEIYGLPQTRLNEVQIEAGASGIVLSSLITLGFDFESGAATSDNRFLRIRALGSGVTSLEASVSNATFVDLDGKIFVDNSAGGTFKNNRFIRTKIHAVSPQIVMQGGSEDTGQNTFVFLNLLTSGGESAYFSDMNDIQIVGLDAESWNWNGTAERALLETEELDSLKIFGFNGGNNKAASFPENKTSIVRTDASVFVAAGATVSNAEDRTLEPNFVFGENVEDAVVLTSNNYSRSEVSEETDYYYSPRDPADASLVVARNDAPVALELEVDAKLGASLSLGDLSAWPVPQKKTLSNPAGDDWQQGRDTASQDDTAELQARIDAEGVVMLDAGVYYVSSSLVLRPNQGLVGKGMSETALVATNPDVDVIRYRPDGESSSAQIVLADLTLQGGRTGFLFEAYGGAGVNVHILTRAHFSHIAFRNMSRAGMLLNFPDSRGGHLDNNLLDNLYFIENAIGFEQATEGSCGDHSCSLMDKVMFHESQFIRNGVGVRLDTFRPGNLNAWVDCIFEDNETQAMYLEVQNTPIIFNSVFSGNAGDPAVESNSRLGHIYRSSFDEGAHQATSLVSRGFMLGSNTFGAGAAVQAVGSMPAGVKSYLFNNATTVPLGIEASEALILSPAD